MKIKNRVPVSVKYCIVILITILIARCDYKGKALKARLVEKIILGSPQHPKELEVAFPFEIYFQDNLDFWRCTPNQPYCKTYENDSIKIRFCHSYNNRRSTYFSGSKEKVEELTHISTVRALKAESVIIENFLKSELMKPIIKIDENFEYKRTGFIIRWKQRSLFRTVHSWESDSEFLSIEFRKLSKKDLKTSYLKNEIDFIVNNLKGKPVANIK